MNSYPSTQKTLQKNVGSTILILVTVYFAFYTIYGNRGVFKLYDLRNDASAASIERDVLRAERSEIEHRVMLMRPKSVDTDMMSEQIRAELSYVHPRDIVVDLK